MAALQAKSAETGIPFESLYADYVLGIADTTLNDFRSRTGDAIEASLEPDPYQDYANLGTGALWNSDKYLDPNFYGPGTSNPDLIKGAIERGVFEDANVHARAESATASIQKVIEQLKGVSGIS